VRISQAPWLWCRRTHRRTSQRCSQRCISCRDSISKHDSTIWAHHPMQYKRHTRGRTAAGQVNTARSWCKDGCACLPPYMGQYGHVCTALWKAGISSPAEGGIPHSALALAHEAKPFCMNVSGSKVNAVDRVVAHTEYTPASEVPLSSWRATSSAPEAGLCCCRWVPKTAPAPAPADLC
jgi:hypothetical protein